MLVNHLYNLLQSRHAPRLALLEQFLNPTLAKSLAISYLKTVHKKFIPLKLAILISFLTPLLVHFIFNYYNLSTLIALLYISFPITMCIFLVIKYLMSRENLWSTARELEDLTKSLDQDLDETKPDFLSSEFYAKTPYLPNTITHLQAFTLKPQAPLYKPFWQTLQLHHTTLPVNKLVLIQPVFTMLCEYFKINSLTEQEAFATLLFNYQSSSLTTQDVYNLLVIGTK